MSDTLKYLFFLIIVCSILDRLSVRLCVSRFLIRICTQLARYLCQTDQVLNKLIASSNLRHMYPRSRGEKKKRNRKTSSAPQESFFFRFCFLRGELPSSCRTLCSRKMWQTGGEITVMPACLGQPLSEWHKPQPQFSMTVSTLNFPS